MSRTLRHVVAVLLLMLLPLQAAATAYLAGAAPIVACSNAMMADGCCEPDGDGGAACHASACFAVAAVAPPLLRALPAPAALAGAPFACVPQLHESYVPDTAQRPPTPRS